MSDERVVEYLRQRGRVAPPHDLVATVMVAIDREPAPRSRFMTYLPAAAAVGVVALVAAIALMLGQGRNIGPAPSSATSASAAPASVEELRDAVTEAAERLAGSPGVEGVHTHRIGDYLASATWFDWRSNGDQVVVARRDIDVEAPWWTDPDGEPLSVGERIDEEILVLVGDAYGRTDDGTWVVSDRTDAPRGPLTYGIGVLDGQIPVVPPIEAGAESSVTRTDLGDEGELWVLEDPQSGQSVTEWRIGPDGVLRSYVVEGPDAALAPDIVASVPVRSVIEFTPLDDPDPIAAPDPDAVPDPESLGLPDGFPLGGEEAEIDYRRYVSDALDFLEAYHWNSPEIDWAAARAAALDGLPDEPDAAQAHQRIRSAIQTFDAFGTVFVRPQDVPPDDFAGQDPALLPTADRIGDVGHVALPQPGGFSAEDLREYLRAARTATAAVEDANPACGWVVDLRDYGGGAWGPPVIALGGLLGEGRAVTFTSGIGEWWLEVDDEGVVTSVGSDGLGAPLDTPYIETDPETDPAVIEAVGGEPPYVPSTPDGPVAVLVSNATARGGEQTLVAFLGRPATRVFGAPTAGMPIVAPNFHLTDGAVLRVPTWVPSDRDGRRYTENIGPDEVVGDTRALGSDAILDAAVAWLEGQPGCD